ncbi:unnamed protein product [Diamesa tonsa]
MHYNKEQFEKICELINKIDGNADSIIISLQNRTIHDQLVKNVLTEKHLSDIFDMFNERSLQSKDFAINLVSVMTSRQMEKFEINGTRIRYSMLSILQKNFQSVEQYKRTDVQTFYNSVYLLGEFYNKAKLANGTPINIMGTSLLGLLTTELKHELKAINKLSDDAFSKLILSQIALNGSLFKSLHKAEIEQLLYTIRMVLIEINTLSSKTKAFLIMALDLYYSNFTNVGSALEEMYQTFLVDEKKTEEPATKSDKGHQGKTHKNNENEDRKLQSSPERTTNSNKKEEKPASTAKPSVIEPKQNESKSTPTSSTSPSVEATKPNTESVSENEQSPAKTKTECLPVVSKSASDKVNNENGIVNGKSKLKSTKSLELPSTESTTSNGNNEDTNILKQQNSQITQVTPVKHIIGPKAYFREENVENLTWDSQVSVEEENELSPKVNPYSKSFLSFLGNN